VFIGEATGVAFYPSREVAMGFPEHRPKGAAEAERSQDQIVEQETPLSVLKPVPLFVPQQARAAVGGGPNTPGGKANRRTLGPETNRDAVHGKKGRFERHFGSRDVSEEMCFFWQFKIQPFVRAKRTNQ